MDAQAKLDMAEFSGMMELSSFFAPQLSTVCSSVVLAALEEVGAWTQLWRRCCAVHAVV